MSATGSPPPGGDKNRAPSLAAVNAVMFTAVAITTFLRVYVRTRVVKSVGWDDYIIFGAFILHIPKVAFEFLSEESGIGRHTFYLSTSELITATKWAKLALFFFVIISWMIKISISVFIVRLANNRSLKWSLTILMSIFTIMTLAWVIVFLAQCRPIQAVWDSTIDGSCWSLNVSVILDDIQGGFAILTDLVLSLSPMVFLWKIQIPIKKKILICCLMATGLIATACCCGRIATTDGAEHKTDETWTLVSDTIWTVLELDISFVAANLPAIFPLFKILRTNIVSRYYRLRSRRNRSNYQSRQQPSAISSFHQLHEMPSNATSNPKSGETEIRQSVGGSESTLHV